jgi:hypothetical protein
MNSTEVPKKGSEVHGCKEIMRAARKKPRQEDVSFPDLEPFMLPGDGSCFFGLGYSTNPGEEAFRLETIQL